MQLVTREMLIGDIVQRYPETLTVLKKYGLPCVGCMGALTESVEVSARRHGVELARLLADLNQVVNRRRKLSLA